MFPDEANLIREITARDSAFRDLAPATLDAAAARLARTASIDDFRLEAMRMLALGGNGHSRAIANAAVSVVPLRFLWLADGPCLVDGPHAGARLVSVNGIPTAEIFTRLRPCLAGTTQRARALCGFMLAWPPAIALATGPRTPPIYRLEAVKGGQFDLAPATTVPAESLYPTGERGPADRLIARQDICGSAAPPGPAMGRLPRQVIYIRIGALSAAPPAATAAHLAEIAQEIRGAHRLIVDLRGNPGGDFFGAAAFAQSLPKVAPGAALAVLVDKFTFSAALVTAALLKVHAGGRLVGEEMGDAAAFHAEGGTEVLPRSGLAIRYSDGWHDWANGKADPVLTPPNIAREMVAAGSLLPEVHAAPTGSDIVAGRDVALTAAIDLVSGEAWPHRG